MKATVIATVYNQAPYVAQMMESVLCQKTNFDFEFIIANDCSTDESGKIIEQYAQKHQCIRYIDNKSNLGLIGNYTQCLEMAQGKYVAGLGGDDFWIDENKLQMQVDFLDANPDYGMVHTQFDELYMYNTFPRRRYRKNCQKGGKSLQGNIFEQLIVNNTICAITMCFVRSLIVDSPLIGKFKNEEFLVEDIPMCLQISSTHKVGFIDKSTVCYRRNKYSVSHSQDLDYIAENHAHSLNIVEYYLSKSPMTQEEVDFYLLQHESITKTYLYFKKRDYKCFRKYYLQLKNKPLDRVIMLIVLRFKLSFLFK